MKAKLIKQLSSQKNKLKNDFLNKLLLEDNTQVTYKPHVINEKKKLYSHEYSTESLNSQVPTVQTNN